MHRPKPCSTTGVEPPWKRCQAIQARPTRIAKPACLFTHVSDQRPNAHCLSRLPPHSAGLDAKLKTPANTAPCTAEPLRNAKAKADHHTPQGIIHHDKPAMNAGFNMRRRTGAGFNLAFNAVGS